LLGFPAVVGLIGGTKTSRPIPKNTDCIIVARNFALMFTLTLFESADYTFSRVFPATTLCL
jgi:hypothetical protein